MKPPRFTRALRLLNLLQSGHGATVEYLANSLKCSTRTVFRDIKSLNENNIRVWYDERLGGYTAEHHLWAVTSSMDEDELTGLLIASVLSPVTRLGPFSGPVDQAIAKLMKSVSPETRQRVNRLVRAIIPPTPPLDLPEQQHGTFQQLVLAIATRHQVRIQSHKATNVRLCSTKLAPYRLAVVSRAGCGRQWTVTGRSTFHRSVVGIPLSDVGSIEMTEDPYEVPTEFLQSGLTGTAAARQADPVVGTIPPPPNSRIKPKRSGGSTLHARHGM